MVPSVPIADYLQYGALGLLGLMMVMCFGAFIWLGRIVMGGLVASLNRNTQAMETMCTSVGELRDHCEYVWNHSIPDIKQAGCNGCKEK